jgi:hypothetical protein
MKAAPLIVMSINLCAGILCAGTAHADELGKIRAVAEAKAEAACEKIQEKDGPMSGTGMIGCVSFQQYKMLVKKFGVDPERAKAVAMDYCQKGMANADNCAAVAEAISSANF